MRVEFAHAAIALAGIIVLALVSNGPLGDVAWRGTPASGGEPVAGATGMPAAASELSPPVGLVQSGASTRARRLAVLNGARARRPLRPFAIPPLRAADSVLPTSPGIRRVRAQYGMEDTWDGYPALRVGPRLVPHPLFGVYLLRGYLALHERRPSAEMREAVRVFARRVIARMELFRGALVFRYVPGLPTPWSRERRYSGLTQSYYAVELLRAFNVTGDELLRRAAELSFRSLLVRVEDGGVLYKWASGVAIAEMPWRPRDLTLNGWASALVSIHTYAELSGSSDALALFRTSVKTLVSLLPLYRAPDYRNSRYKLAGPITARLEILGDHGAVRIASLRIHIRRDGWFRVHRRPPDLMRSTVAPEDVMATASGLAPTRRSLRLFLHLSRISHPTPNELRATVVADQPVQLRLRVLDATYDPLMPNPVPFRWRDASAVSIPSGRSEVSLPIPWTHADLVSQLTTFRTLYDGRRTNIYHATHISRLEQLYERTGMTALKRQADEWRADACAWARVPLYAGLYVIKGTRSVSPVEYCPS